MINFHLGYSMSGADFIFRGLAETCFKDTTILTIEKHKHCLVDYSRNHFISCYKNIEAFFNHDIPLDEMGKDDAFRCTESPCYAINIPPDKLDIRHGDKVTLYMVDPLVSASNTYSMLKEAKYPWMRLNLHDFHSQCNQFSHPPVLHWFNPTREEMIEDFKRAGEYVEKIALVYQSQLLNSFESYSVEGKVHLITGTDIVNDHDITAYEGMLYSNITPHEMEDVTCSSLSQYRSDIGVPVRKCSLSLNRYLILIFVIPCFVCWCFLSKNRNRREEEVVPLKH